MTASGVLYLSVILTAPTSKFSIRYFIEFRAVNNKKEINEVQSRRYKLHKGCVLIKRVNGATGPFYNGTSCLSL